MTLPALYDATLAIFFCPEDPISRAEQFVLIGNKLCYSKQKY